ncbi:SGNH/GDSL hydrolase family protein [Aquabacter cavernae]|uniref:SGNH/GDSL hydrolase family protein n=1 Tax=Aquabacter cavernae TaxID=2496029 RepID=UPI000F8DEB8F|nr:SGNH/GDSL hydrolase family protein [Aquabacter cavernae]
MERGKGILRDVVLCVIITVCTVVFVAGAGEIYLRLARPFLFDDQPQVTVPGVGLQYQPGAMVHRTNQLDFWVSERANADGFLAAPPTPYARARDACRVALIGDSMVDGREVPISEKMQTRMEELAPGLVPGARLMVNAYSYTGAGQLNQLAFYDRYAAKFRPNVIVLVFVRNDFANNSVLLEAIRYGFSPDHPPRAYAQRTAGGSIQMLSMDDGWRDHVMNTARAQGFAQRAHLWLTLHSYFYNWIYVRLAMVTPHFAAWLYGYDQGQANLARLEALRQRPGNAALLEGYDGHSASNDNPFTAFGSIDEPFASEKMPPAFEEAIAFTGFALDQFLARAQRDGASLVILSTENMRQFDPPGDRRFKRLEALAQARDIPVIDLYDFIRSQGRDAKDASFVHEPHWNAQGHLWAAQALLDYIKAHPALCTQAGGRASTGPASPGGGR